MEGLNPQEGAISGNKVSAFRKQESQTWNQVYDDDFDHGGRIRLGTLHFDHHDGLGGNVTAILPGKHACLGSFSSFRNLHNLLLS